VCARVRLLYLFLKFFASEFHTFLFSNFPAKKKSFERARAYDSRGIVVTITTSRRSIHRRSAGRKIDDVAKSAPRRREKI